MIVKQHRRHHQSTFDVYESSEKRSPVRRLRVPYVKTRNSKGEERHIIYDEEMRVIRPIYSFLNNSGGKNPNIIKQRVTALRLLVAFCEAHKYNNFKIPSFGCIDFIDFLGDDGNKSNRSSAIYFNVIKAFFIFIGQEDSPLLEHTVKSFHFTGADGQVRSGKRTKYKHEPNVIINENCPPYNTKDEFRRILEVIQQRKDKEAELLVSLMMTGGFRIGELLGLTLEDLHKNYDCNNDWIISGFVIRNRTSDRDGQSAKNRTRPQSHADYKSKNYIIVAERDIKPVSDKLQKLLADYVKEKHSWACKQYPERYRNAKADVVDPVEFEKEWGLKENHYLFLNEWGDSLKRESWNKRLRSYYQEAQISTKGKSLNHAFRHGVAMILRHDEHCMDEEIAAFLGHRGTQTVSVYAKADNKMLCECQNRIARYLNDEISNSDDIEKAPK